MTLNICVILLLLMWLALCNIVPIPVQLHACIIQKGDVPLDVELSRENNQTWTI